MDLVTKTPGAVATTEAWGSEGASNNDILVPRLMLMHDISQLVKDKKAEAGDIISSTDGQILAKAGSGVEIIPITTYREWLVHEIDPRGDEKYLARFPITPQNEHLEKEGVQDGKGVRRYRTLNFFVLVANKIDELPYLVTFKKSGLMAGKQLSTHFQVSAMKRKPPAATVFKLGSTNKSFERHTFKVFTIEQGRATTQEELVAARNWYEILNKQSVKAEGEFDDSFDTQAFGG
jgi:hypothetical protein